MSKPDEVIQVAMTELDTYGNLKVTDIQGNEYKVGEKRSQLHGLFQDGRAVKITWAEYKGKEYISDAELYNPGGDTEPTPETTEPPKKTPEPLRPTVAPQARGMLVKETGDMMRAKMLVEIYGKKIASNWITWYRTEALGIAQFPYDGKDLPKFKDE